MLFHVLLNIAERIITEANQAVPEETCGILVGRNNVITNAISIPNIAATPERAFVLEPSALVKAINSAGSLGQEVIGFYHSHPQHAAQPSPTDIREWNYPDLLMVIASVKENKIAAWQVQGVAVTPVELVFGEASVVTPEIPLSNAGKTAIIVSVVLAIIAVLVVSLTLLPPAPPIP